MVGERGAARDRIEGAIRLGEGELLVSFRYNKSRYNTVRRIKETRYNKDKRLWHVPLEGLSTLEKSVHFQPPMIKYDFDRSHYRQQLESRVERELEASRRVERNPFEVSEEDLALINPEVVLRMAKNGLGLRVYVRTRSKVKQLVEGFSEAHYIKNERAYAFPVANLTLLLQELQTLGKSFGVAAEAGRQLRSTAGLRRSIINKKHAPEPHELLRCLLIPYIEPTLERGRWQLSGYTTEELRRCFPGVGSYGAKRQRAKTLTTKQLLQLLYDVSNSGSKVWLCRAAEMALSELRQMAHHTYFVSDAVFPDALLAVALPPLAWVTIPGVGAGVLCSVPIIHELQNNSAGRELLKIAEELSWPQTDQHLFFKLRDGQVLDHLNALTNGFTREAPQSESFVALVKDLQRRQKLLSQQRWFQQQRDLPCKLENVELAGKLFPHQRVAVRWFLKNRRGLLGDDMGLGKTLVVLAGFAELCKSGKADFLLVVCPNSLVRNWIRESQTWVPEIKLIALPNGRRERGKALDQLVFEPEQVKQGLVINYECLRRPDVYPRLKELCARLRVQLCLDESQRVKNPKSKTFEALYQIAPACERRVLLSGTPTPKDITDIWSQLLLLDDGERLGTNYYSWLEQVAVLGNKWSEFAVQEFRPGAVADTVLRVQEVLLRRRKEDVIDLPEKVFTFRDIELTGDQLKRYDEIREELLLRVTSASGETFVRQIDSILEEYLRAVQVACNPRLIDERWEGVPAKFKELDNIVEELVLEQERKLVVWTNYRRNVDELLQRYAHCRPAALTGAVTGSDRAAVVESFQSTEPTSVQMLIAIPAAGGVGLTLTAAQTAVYLDRTWNAEHWMQSIDRLHRIGQQGVVNIIVLNACRVDEIIGFNLRRKQRAQRELLGDGRVVEPRAMFPTREELLSI